MSAAAVVVTLWIAVNWTFNIAKHGQKVEANGPWATVIYACLIGVLMWAGLYG